jgi:hypothetical protein
LSIDITNIADICKKRYNTKSKVNHALKGGTAMPRYQPPKDYYTATQVKKILNISGAMIANYVEKGKIKHIVPPERKHGYYLKKDVDKLANELETFFNLEEDAESTNLTAATKAEIPVCVNLNRELFTATLNSTDNTTLYEKWAKWMDKNPEIVYVLKADQEIVGIAITLPVKPNSEKLNKALMADISMLQGDIDISAEDIEEYKEGNHIQLYISGIGIKPSLNKDLRRKYGARLISRFAHTITDLGKRGVIIETATAVGATRSGIKVLQHYGFNEVVFPRSDTRLFTLNMKESGAPIAQTYREALKEKK